MPSLPSLPRPPSPPLPSAVPRPVRGPPSLPPSTPREISRSPASSPPASRAPSARAASTASRSSTTSPAPSEPEAPDDPGPDVLEADVADAPVDEPAMNLPPDHTRLLADQVRVLRSTLREAPSAQSWEACEEAWTQAVALAAAAVRLPTTSSANSQRDVRGPGRGGSVYHARELVKTLRHLLLSDAWVYLHDDLFKPTRISRTTASRIDRIYLPDFLLTSLEECDVLDLPDGLKSKTDHSPVVATIRGTPARFGDSNGWRIDASLLGDEVSTGRITERLQASLERIGTINPERWDRLKDEWKTILQEEGKARQRRLTCQRNELLRRMRIIKAADSLTSCMSDYLESLETLHNRLLHDKSRRGTKISRLLVSAAIPRASQAT
ncbi:hypothetical protein HPB52_023198 [Rhipicephalus sanguineus]|uniref:Endonuclease/exonuclease/phosphatase domain-containing protein n=1 Tax=Rhipicephalus sanguineus TaxID=34632 RepID=A0A9D4QB35_RHISA|nr:hypothetical protein HPB52_023198 [Rhipicephalus sanguineus]